MNDITSINDFHELCLLHIEDELDDALIVQRFIKDTFFYIHEESLQDAFKRLENQQIDLILLDLNLPESTGLDTLIAVMNKAKEIPIVVLTGFDDETLGLDAVSNGAEDYLVKSHMKDNRYLINTLKYAYNRSSHRLSQHKSVSDEDTFNTSNELLIDNPDPVLTEVVSNEHSTIDSFRAKEPLTFLNLQQEYIKVLQKALVTVDEDVKDSLLTKVSNLFHSHKLNVVDVVDLHTQAIFICKSKGIVPINKIEKNEKSTLLKLISLYN